MIFEYDCCIDDNDFRCYNKKLDKNKIMRENNEKEKNMIKEDFAFEIGQSVETATGEKGIIKSVGTDIIGAKFLVEGQKGKQWYRTEELIESDEILLNE